LCPVACSDHAHMTGNRTSLINTQGLIPVFRNNPVVGPYGETRINDNGERLIVLCESYNLRITNGYFKHKMIHKYTWEQHTRNFKSIIDYIIVKQKSKFQIHDVRVQRGINCGLDH